MHSTTKIQVNARIYFKAIQALVGVGKSQSRHGFIIFTNRKKVFLKLALLNFSFTLCVLFFEVFFKNAILNLS